MKILLVIQIPQLEKREVESECLVFSLGLFPGMRWNCNQTIYYHCDLGQVT